MKPTKPRWLRRALLTGASAVLVAAGALVTISTAPSAEAGSLPNAPQFVFCNTAPNNGAVTAFAPAGAGALTVSGWAAPCRTPGTYDTLAVAWYQDGGGSGLSKAGFLRYGTQVQGRVQIPAGTTLVCLLDTPWHALGCQTVHVRDSATGTADVPVLGAPRPAGAVPPYGSARTFTGDPDCALCW